MTTRKETSHLKSRITLDSEIDYKDSLYKIEQLENENF